MVTVSVLMCVYNGQKDLKEAIDSILNQNYTNFEFIIVNDCSTDNSAAIINSYTDNRIKLFTNETNLGLAASLNVGLQAAQGEYIVRMDSDDISLPHRLQTQVDYMNAHTNIGVCGSWIKVFGDANYCWKPKANAEYLRCKLLFNTPLPHPTWIIRHSLIKQHNLYYSQTMRRAQDYDFLVRMSAVSQLGCIQQCLLNYRYEFVTRKPENHNEALKNIFAVRKELLEKLGVDFTEEEHQLHHLLSESKFKSPELSPQKVGKWLTKLLRANAKSKVYNHTKLRVLIGELWMQTLMNNLAKAIPAKLSYPNLWLSLLMAVGSISANRVAMLLHPNSQR
jgi:glycosyltransferase involved in cell wall biosynthesis